EWGGGVRALGHAQGSGSARDASRSHSLGRLERRSLPRGALRWTARVRVAHTLGQRAGCERVRGGLLERHWEPVRPRRLRRPAHAQATRVGGPRRDPGSGERRRRNRLESAPGPSLDPSRGLRVLRGAHPGRSRNLGRSRNQSALRLSRVKVAPGALSRARRGERVFRLSRGQGAGVTGQTTVPSGVKGGCAGTGRGSGGKRTPQSVHWTFVQALVPSRIAVTQSTRRGTPPEVSVYTLSLPHIVCIEPVPM